MKFFITNEEVSAMIERHKIDHVVQLDWKW